MSDEAVKIALFQMDQIWEDVEENLKKLERAVEEAKSLGASFLFTPEMSLSGFTKNAERVAVDEKVLSKILDLSKGITIGLGYVRKEGDDFKNSYSIVEDGRILCTYDKIHLFSHGGEHEVYSPGNTLAICESRGLRISPLVCYDLRFPCPFQRVAENADFFVVGASWPSSRKLHWRSLLIARAIENQAFVVGVNRVGRDPFFEYSGGSLVVSPWGEVVLEMGDFEGVGFAWVNPKDARKTRDIFPVLNDRVRNLDFP